MAGTTGNQSEPAMCVIMSRFQAREQLTAFRATPPVKVLCAGGQGLQLQAKLQFEVTVEPAEPTRSSIGQ